MESRSECKKRRDEFGLLGFHFVICSACSQGVLYQILLNFLATDD